MEIWKLSGPYARLFVRFGKEDTLVFDLADLTPSQACRVVDHDKAYIGLVKVNGLQPCFQRFCDGGGWPRGAHAHSSLDGTAFSLISADQRDKPEQPVVAAERD